jgi:hypothetical protein
MDREHVAAAGSEFEVHVDESRTKHRRFRSGLSIATTIAVVALLLHGCDSDGGGFAWLGGSHVGKAGATGAAGTQGLQGVPGERGATGLTGMTGRQGLQGEMGLRGLRGLQGIAGLAGRDGINGTNGINGAAGPSGPAGATGAMGPQGPAGTSGIGDSGSFWDITTQGDDGPGGYLPDTAYPMLLGQADSANNQGVSITSGSRITFTNSGVYNIAFSAQVTRSQGGSASNITIWLRRNGVDVPDSATDFTLQANSQRYVAAWNFFAPVTCTTSCDYYELMWSAESEYTALVYLPAQTGPVRPAIPSVIMTVNQVK